MLANSSCCRCYFSKHTNMAELLSGWCLPDAPVHAKTPPTHPGVSGCQQFWGLKEAGPPGPPRTPSVPKAPARCTFECLSKLGIRRLPNPASSVTESSEPEPQPRHGSEHFYQRPRLLLCSVTGKEIKMDQKNPACCPKH